MQRNFAELPTEIILREILPNLDPKFVSTILPQINERLSNIVDELYWKNKIENHFPHADLSEVKFNQYGYRKIEMDKYPDFSEQEKELVRLIKEIDIEAIENFPITIEMWDKKDKSGPIILSIAQKFNYPPLISCLNKVSFAAALRNYTKEDGELDHKQKDEFGRTILYWAFAFQREVETLIELTAQGGLDQLYSNEFQVFHLAIKENRLDFIKALFHDQRFNDSIGSLLEQRDVHGQTPLILAAKNNFSEMVLFLLDLTNYDAFTDQLNSPDYGKSAFYWLVAAGNLEMVKIFIEKFPHLLEEKDISGKTPLMWAVISKHVSIVKFFLEQKANPDIKIDKPGRFFHGRTALSFAIENGNLEIISIFIENFPYLLEKRDIFGEVPLIWAAEKGETDVLKHLLDKGANPNIRTEKLNHENDRKSPLYWAVFTGHAQAVKLLIESGAIDNHQYGDEKCQLIHLATMHNRLDLFKALLETIPNLHYIAEHNHSIQTARNYIVKDRNTKKYIIKDLAYLYEAEDAYKQTPLLLAAKGGHFEIVKYLLDKGVNPNVQTNKPNNAHEHMKTALTWAYLSGDINSVALLITKGARTSIAALSSQSTILHSAARLGQFEMLKAIIENDPDAANLIEQKDFYNQTAILLAAHKNQLEIVKYLLKRSANPHVSSYDPENPDNKDNGKTPLAWAYSVNNLSVVAELYKATRGKIDVPKGMSSLQFRIGFMHFATLNNDLELVKIFVEENKDKNEFLNPTKENSFKIPLMLSMINNSLEIVEYLLSQGADPNIVPFDGNNIAEDRPINWACERGNTDIVRILVNYGADRTFYGRKSMKTPIDFIAYSGNLEMMKALLENNSQSFNLHHKNDSDSFFTAAKMGHTDILKYLLDKETERNGNLTKDYINIVKYINIAKTDALHHALKNEHLDSVFFLLKSLKETGANIKSLFPFLSLAIRKNYFEGIKFCILLEKNNEKRIELLNQKDWQGITPLMLAIQESNIEIVEYLLSQGANPNIASKFFNFISTPEITPLAYACQNNRVDIVEKLLAVGNINLYRFHPLEKAVSAGNTEIASLLLKEMKHDFLHNSGELKKVLEIVSRKEIFAILTQNEFNKLAKQLKTIDDKNKVVNKKIGEFFQNNININLQQYSETIIIEDYTNLFWHRQNQMPAFIKCIQKIKISYENEKSISENMLNKVRRFPNLPHLIANFKVDQNDAEIFHALFLKMIEEGNIKIMKAFLNNKDINPSYIKWEYWGSERDQMTALSQAAHFKHAELVKLFIQAGADCNPIKGGYTPFMWAVRKGHVEIVKTFLNERSFNNLIRDEKDERKLQKIFLELRADVELNQISKKEFEEISTLITHARTPLFHYYPSLRRILN